MFSFELVYFASFPAGRVRLKIFRLRAILWRAAGFYGSSKKLLAARIRKDYNPNGIIFMRSKLLVVCILGFALTGGAFAAVVVEKRSHQMPYVEVFGCEGIHAFVFRGPKGTSRRPILVPPREYWSAAEAGQYKFLLRYGSGEVCSRLVTPEVFARYQVGDDFNDCATVTQRSQTEDSKSVQPVVHHRQPTAQLRKRSHTSRHVAKHHRVRRTHRLASR